MFIFEHLLYGNEQLATAGCYNPVTPSGLD